MNEGEGNKTAAKHYNQATQKFVQEGKVGPAAKAAEKAVDGPEGEELRRAEEIGKNRIAEEDPDEKPRR